MNKNKLRTERLKDLYNCEENEINNITQSNIDKKIKETKDNIFNK